MDRCIIEHWIKIVLVGLASLVIGGFILAAFGRGSVAQQFIQAEANSYLG